MMTTVLASSSRQESSSQYTTTRCSSGSTSSSLRLYLVPISTWACFDGATPALHEILFFLFFCSGAVRNALFSEELEVTTNLCTKYPGMSQGFH